MAARSASSRLDRVCRATNEDRPSDGASWATEYGIPAPTTASTWQSWSRNETYPAGSYWARLESWNLGFFSSDARLFMVEFARATVSLDSSQTPTITIGAEQSQYVAAAAIVNETTGESIRVDFSMDLGET